MDEVREKMKGLMKKVTSSSSSGKFKGQGRVLGTSTSSSADSVLLRSTPPSQSTKPKSNPNPNPIRNSPLPDSKPVNRKPAAGSGDGFDPFDALVTPSKRSQNGFTLNVFECPICNQPFRSEDEVSTHVDVCVNVSQSLESDGIGMAQVGNDELEVCVSTFVSGKKSDGSVEVVLRLLRNVVKEPENGKFRRIRMGNPKIREAIGDVPGGVELLEAVGFGLREEDGEMCAVMDLPSQEQSEKISRVISLLERPSVENVASLASSDKEESAAPVEPKKVDRQV